MVEHTSKPNHSTQSDQAHERAPELRQTSESAPQEKGQHNERPLLGVIGGTGLYSLPGLAIVNEHQLDTPFGLPSAPIIEATIGEQTIYFLARHGHGHTLLPSEINYRANIFALKMLGVSWILSVSAVGSLREELSPGDAVVPDQFIDRTKHRSDTFFGNGIAAHVGFGRPICPVLSAAIFDAAQSIAANPEAGATDRNVHRGGIYVCMEGPAFSTRAESEVNRALGASVIGMTNLTEAKLAREAEISYANLALVTDYDAWRGEEDEVDGAKVMALLRENVSFAQSVIRAVAPRIVTLKQPDFIRHALASAILTPPNAIPAATRARLKPLLSHASGEMP